MTDYIEYLNFIIDNKITQTQYMFMYLLYYKDIDANTVICISKKYHNYIDEKRLLSDFEKQDLIDREFVIKIGEGNKLGDYLLTDKFLSKFVDPYIVGNQIWDMYPAFSVSNTGVKFPLKGMDKNQFRAIYSKQINYNSNEHNEVLKDLQYAITNNLIKVKIENFVKSELWKDIRNERIKNDSRTKVISDYGKSDL